MDKLRILALASLWLAACSSNAARFKDGECFIGEAGCTCTAGRGCDPGLECTEDRVCIEPSSTEPEWIQLEDTAADGDTIASHDVPEEFYQLLVVGRQMFLTYREERMIRVLDLDDGSVTEIPVDWYAEMIAADSSTGTVVVTLRAGHDDPLNETGQLALIDVASLDSRIVEIPFVPGDVVTNGAGTAFVSLGDSPRGPWSALAVDLPSGKFVQYVNDEYRESESISMHPRGDRIYAIETNSNPGHILRWNVEGNVLTDTVVSDTTFDWNWMELDPSGHTAYLIDGTLVNLGNNPFEDMEPTGALTPDGRWLEIAFDPTGDRAYTIPKQGLGVWIFDTKSKKQIGDYRATTDHYIYHIASGPKSFFVVEGSRMKPGSDRVDEVPFP